MRRARLGIRDPRRSVASFIFNGPPGVGKTELARGLAATILEDEEAVVELDMSEYAERSAVSKLVGAAPGYVGYGDGGRLTEPVRRRPYTVVLLDEIEKAHEDAWNVPLQVLEEGTLTDGEGRPVSFRQALVIMTSNVGTGAARQAVGFAASSSAQCRDERLRKVFPAGFLDRVDEIVYFDPFSEQEIERICWLETERIIACLREQGYRVELDPAAISLLAEAGFSDHDGARPLRRHLQRTPGDALAAALERRKSKSRRRRVRVRNGELAVT